MVIKFNPEGQVIMTMGRKPEAINIPSGPAPGTHRHPRRFSAEIPAVAVPAAPVGAVRPLSGLLKVRARPATVSGDRRMWPGTLPEIFLLPTDMTIPGWRSSTRMGNTSAPGGSRGTQTGQFHTVHSIATDANGTVYVGDRENKRIQVFDNDGNFKTEYINVGAPWAICITPGPHQYLYSSNSNGTGDFDNGEIYKMELDGKILGKFGHGGQTVETVRLSP